MTDPVADWKTKQRETWTLGNFGEMAVYSAIPAAHLVRFAGIRAGQPMRDFFDKLVTRRYASTYPFGPNGAPLFHVHHKALYRAIGEPDSRYRRRGSVARAVERLIVLDAVLATGSYVTWLATEHEKVAHCVHQRQVDVGDLPAITFRGEAGQTTRYFADKLPLGVGSRGDDLVLLYVAADASGRTFRAFLERHERLLLRMRTWRVIVAIPRGLQDAESIHQQVFTEFCAAPLRPAVLDEFRWFCAARRTLERSAQSPGIDMVRYARARRAFGAPRFFSAYRDWLQRGEPALLRLMSPALHDARQRGMAAVETLAIPHLYGEAGALVRTA
jgi:hypothetical protein